MQRAPDANPIGQRPSDHQTPPPAPAHRLGSAATDDTTIHLGDRPGADDTLHPGADGPADHSTPEPEGQADPGEGGGWRRWIGRLRLLGGWPGRIVLIAAVCAAAVIAFPSGQEPADHQPTTWAERVLTPPTLVVRKPAQPGPTTTVPEAAAVEAILDPSPLFVSPTLGNDGNDGRSAEAPLQSFQRTLDRVEPGDTIYLMDGFYEEVFADNFHYVLRRDGTPDAWIKITAAPGHNPVLRASIGTAIDIQANYVEVSGLTVRGVGFDENVSFGVGLSVRKAHHVRLVGNSVGGMPLAGISCIESSNLEVLNNDIFENAFWSPAQGSGISFWHSLDWEQPPADDGYHDRIIGNRIYRNENRVKSMWENYTTITDGNGIIIDQNQAFNYTGRTLIANNVIFDNGGRGILVFESNRVDVMHNTTYNNGWTVGLNGGPVELAASKANDVRFLNNLGWALPDAPAIVKDRSNNVESAGNVLITTAPSGDASERDRVIGVDPGVAVPGIDENSNDFRPEPTGVLVGRGVETRPALPYDAAGRLREPGAPTVGAYEVELG